MMKKIIFSIAIVLLATMTMFGQKIGHLNSQEILQDMPDVKAAESYLESFQLQLQKKGQAMVEAFQKKYQEIARKEQQGEMSPRQLEEETAKLKAEEEKIQKYEQDMQLQIVKKREELLQPILDRVNEAIEAVSKEKGYLYIIDLSSGMILYGDDNYDITKEVKSKLDLM
jgi:outer membrane protein